MHIKTGPVQTLTTKLNVSLLKPINKLGEESSIHSDEMRLAWLKQMLKKLFLSIAWMMTGNAAVH